MRASKERPGILFILIGPGGVGKNALLNEILTRTENLRQLPTATTRNMRPNEQQGREHLFVSPEEFKDMIVNDDLLEHQEVHPGLFYGVPRATVDEAITTGHDLMADIEVLGAEILREKYPENTVAIFVAPPSIDALKDRLKTREASKKDTKDRLSRLPMEMRYAPLCDYVIVNDAIDNAIDELHTVVRLARGELVLPVENYPMHQVTYEVQITPIVSGDVLHRDSGSLKASVAGGQAPDAVALAEIGQVLGIVAEAELLKMEALDDEVPLSCTYHAESNTYCYVYHYTYTLDESFVPPQGWHRQSVERVGELS